MVLAAGQPWYLFAGDNRNLMGHMGDSTIDAIVTDPPYELTSIVKRFGGPNSAPQKYGRDGAHARLSGGFMSQRWDSTGIAHDAEFWAEVLRVLKPGGHLVAFSGTRTYHRMAVAIEDAGFEIRDMLEWLYGSGFPKGGLDDEGRGPALKPAHEPMCLARKSFKGSAAGCVETYGTGLLNIDDCRIESADAPEGRTRHGGGVPGGSVWLNLPDVRPPMAAGRFPANVCHDGSPEVLGAFPQTTSGGGPAIGTARTKANTYGEPTVSLSEPYGSNSGSAARFYYCAKASKSDRDEGCEHLEAHIIEMAGRKEGRSLVDGNWVSLPTEPKPRSNTHPTVKPTDLMRWLVRLVCPPGGLVFDPFTGSGSTGKAAMLEGRRFIGAEMTAEYVPIARARIEAARLTAGSN